MTVTAIVVSHANETGLRKILDNLLRQTRPPDEIVVLCSEMDVADVSADFPGIAFHVCENRNDWGHEKRAQGLELARSEWVGFFNDDDSYEDHYLETMLNHATAESSDVVYCAWNEIPQHTEFRMYQSTAGNFLCRTQLGKKIGWTGRHYEADGAFIDALAASGAQVVKVNEVLYHHNVQ